jgi:hypothetical protein
MLDRLIDFLRATLQATGSSATPCRSSSPAWPTTWR